MTTNVNEKIKVVSLFENGKIKPFLFSWRNRHYRIFRQIFSYSKSVGREKIFYFSVDAGGVFFELAFNQQKFSWEITKIF